MTEADTDLLRRAATAMRERARKATPGPWVPREIDFSDRSYVVLPVLWSHEARNDVLNLDGPGAPNHADATHIASWHPAVALAVADWLDSVATAMEHGGDERALWLQSALAVARAYLGQTA